MQAPAGPIPDLLAIFGGNFSGQPQGGIYAFLLLFLNVTSRETPGAPQASPRGHAPDPLAIIEEHQSGVSVDPSGRLLGAMFLFLCLYLKDFSQAFSGATQATPRGHASHPLAIPEGRQTGISRDTSGQPQGPCT